MFRIALSVLVLSGVLAVAGCGGDDEDATVTGTVSYRERIAIVGDAEVRVELLDVSRQDAPARKLAEQVQTLEGRQVPIPFELTYDADDIDERFTYAVRGEIVAGDKVLFRSTQTTPVITRGNPVEDVELVLTKASSSK